MEYFRIDKRLYEIGTVITPSNSYQLELDKKGLLLEKKLENYRLKHKPQRGKYLFVFNEYNDAKKFWKNMINGKFYRVSVEVEDILHKGDMKITEMLFTLENSDIDKLCNDYWNSIGYAIPCWEYIVKKAQVLEIVSSTENKRRSEIKKSLGI